MDKIDLKEVEKLIKTATEFRDKEKEKFKVGLILKESIDSLRRTISSLAQMELRGEKVNSARLDNMRALRLLLLNLIDLGIILGMVERSGVLPLIAELEAKTGSRKQAKSQPAKVSG